MQPHIFPLCSGNMCQQWQKHQYSAHHAFKTMRCFPKYKYVLSKPRHVTSLISNLTRGRFAVDLALDRDLFTHSRGMMCCTALLNVSCPAYFEPCFRIPRHLADGGRSGSMMMRQLHFAMLDLELHARFKPGGKETVFDVDHRIAQKTMVMQPLPEDRYCPPSFPPNSCPCP